MNLSFAGCGFLGIYHVGVATCLRQYAPHLWADKISGASAGAIAACALITGCELGSATSYVLRVATQARARALGPLHPGFNVVQEIRTGLNKFLPSDAHKICSGRLNISLTRVSDWQNVLVNNYETREDLIQALICSAFVPFYCGIFPPKFKGERYVDGSLSNNNPVLDDNTIVVSPFCGESDICPDDKSSSYMHITLAGTSLQLSSANLYRLMRVLFPPKPEMLMSMCQQGFDDTLRYLSKNNLLNCSKHLSQPSCLNLLDSEQCSSKLTEECGQVMSQSNNDDYNNDDDDDDSDTCTACSHQRHVALIDSMPASVLEALKMACDSVNQGVLAPVYNSRLFRVIALMATPCILPLDLILICSQRFYEWAPYLPSDLQWFVKEFIHTLQDMIALIQSSRHRYSARFTCQLAIVESDNKPKRKSISTGSNYYVTSRHYSLEKFDAIAYQSTQRRRRNLNLGFSVDFTSSSRGSDDDVIKVDDVIARRSSICCRHDVIRCREKEECGLSRGELEELRRRRMSDVPLMLMCKDSREREDREPGDEAMLDTFERCLYVATQLDAINLSYYLEEDRGSGSTSCWKDKTLKKVEEFVKGTEFSDRSNQQCINPIGVSNFMEVL